MIPLEEKKIIVGLDIGTTKVSTLIGEILIDNTINIIGIGTCQSRGIYNGIINDLESVIKCVKQSIHAAEVMSQTNVNSIFLSISTKDINCQNEIGIIPINKRAITKLDIDNIIHTAKSVPISNEHHILHVIPQEYAIDQQIGIKNPIGLSGIRMTANVHLITCHSTIKKNIIKSIKNCGIQINQIVFSGLASSIAVLTQEEKELGVCLIDIGGGTLDITIYIDGILRHSQVIPYAGNSITNDIAYAFSTSYTNAEKIKIKYGNINSYTSSDIEYIEVMNKSGIYNQKFKIHTLTEIIEPRCSELLYLVNNEIVQIQNSLKKSGKNYQLLAGIVLTGGSAKIKSLTVCAEKIFNKKVRIGLPNIINGIIDQIHEPDYSTVLGLLYYGRKKYHKNKQRNIIEKQNFCKKWLKKINSWVKKII